MAVVLVMALLMHTVLIVEPWNEHKLLSGSEQTEVHVNAVSRVRVDVWVPDAQVCLAVHKEIRRIQSRAKCPISHVGRDVGTVDDEAFELAVVEVRLSEDG